MEQPTTYRVVSIWIEYKFCVNFDHRTIDFNITDEHIIPELWSDFCQIIMHNTPVFDQTWTLTDELFSVFGFEGLCPTAPYYIYRSDDVYIDRNQIIQWRNIGFIDNLILTGQDFAAGLCMFLKSLPMIWSTTCDLTNCQVHPGIRMVRLFEIYSRRLFQNQPEIVLFENFPNFSSLILNSGAYHLGNYVRPIDGSYNCRIGAYFGRLFIIYTLSEPRGIESTTE